MPPCKVAPIVQLSTEDLYLRCQTFGHAWDDISGTGVAPTHNVTYLSGSRIVLRCIRCATTREDVINNHDGGLIHRNYVYPDGYRLVRDKGMDAPKRTDFRLKYISRFADLFVQ